MLPLWVRSLSPSRRALEWGWHVCGAAPVASLLQRSDGRSEGWPRFARKLSHLGLGSWKAWCIQASIADSLGDVFNLLVSISRLQDFRRDVVAGFNRAQEVAAELSWSKVLGSLYSVRD